MIVLKYRSGTGIVELEIELNLEIRVREELKAFLFSWGIGIVSVYPSD